MSDLRRKNKRKGKATPDHEYRCQECGCEKTSYEMGEMILGWHYEGCSHWDSYVDAGPAK